MLLAGLCIGCGSPQPRQGRRGCACAALNLLTSLPLPQFNEAFVEGDYLCSIMNLCLGGSLDSAIRCAWLAPARPAPARPAVRRRLASPLRTPNRTCLHAPCVPPLTHPMWRLRV